MEHPGPFGQHHLHLLLHAVEGHMLQGPVPVIVIILNKPKYIANINSKKYFAKTTAATHNFIPFCFCESHSHVVLGGHPFTDFSLEIQKMFIFLLN